MYMLGNFIGLGIVGINLFWSYSSNDSLVIQKAIKNELVGIAVIISSLGF